MCGPVSTVRSENWGLFGEEGERGVISARTMTRHIWPPNHSLSLSETMSTTSIAPTIARRGSA